MNTKYIPFQPNNPVFKTIFRGRANELKRIDELLLQTKNENPTNILLVGERGIGKTSLLLVANFFAKGEINWEDIKHNFITAQLTIDHKTTIIDLAKKIDNCIEREVNRITPGLDFLKKTWAFISKFEAAGFKFKEDNKGLNTSEIIDNLSLSIADTVKALTSPTAISDIGITKQIDGIVILIDEADNASKELELGVFVKNLSEILIKEKANKVLLILSGLPNLRTILHDSHPSSLRLFEEFELKPLTDQEIKDVIKQGISEYNEKNKPAQLLTINDDALNAIAYYSEGYPHFVQQIGASVLLINDDDVITFDDVAKGVLGKGGAIDLIGDRYYKDLYYNKINVDSYRQILDIMAQKWNDWISREEIRKSFKGKDSTLRNGLKALLDRHIILPKPGTRGQYRLQWMSFAYWIKSFAESNAK